MSFLSGWMQRSCARFLRRAVRIEGKNSQICIFNYHDLVIVIYRDVCHLTLLHRHALASNRLLRSHVSSKSSTVCQSLGPLDLHTQSETSGRSSESDTRQGLLALPRFNLFFLDHLALSENPKLAHSDSVRKPRSSAVPAGIS